jgi:LysR family transcriptional regulator, benzoate and cis,cis-muconate-responsive activator of ben and cat genes
VDLHQLRCFVAVAEELHFSRAAARLNLAQSAVSAHVRHLEDEIGAPLFIRGSRSAQLTVVGERLLDDAREVLAGADRALARAQAGGRQERGILTLGSIGPALVPLLAPLLSAFADLHPSTQVEIRTYGFSEVITAVVDRRVDAAFVHLPLEESDLMITPVLEEPRVVVMPADHRFASHASLCAADLADEQFVTHSPSVAEVWRDYWLLVPETGRRPRVSPRTADNLEDYLMLIARGEGIDTAPEHLTRYAAWPDLTYVPLVDVAPATLALVRRRDAGDLTEAFVQLACSVAAKSAG